jgi:hypothetical protein
LRCHIPSIFALSTPKALPDLTASIKPTSFLLDSYSFRLPIVLSVTIFHALLRAVILLAILNRTGQGKFAGMESKICTMSKAN